MPNRHMKLVINVDNQKVDVLTPLASSSVTDALGYTPMNSSDRGATNGVASLTSGKVPASELPSYVDDVIEGYYYNNNFYSDPAHTQPIAGGEPGKIYVDLAHDSSYRYTGSAYVEISQSITVDNAMNTTSTNPVQNRIITEVINNINSMLGALGGTVNISSLGASDGSVVTCTKGSRNITSTILNESCIMDLVPGTWSITVNDTAQSLTSTTSVTVQVDGSYNINLPLKGTVNITASDITDNSVISCTNGVDTITSSVLSESCVLLVPTGTWTITVNDTTQSFSRSTLATVQAGNTYNVDLSYPGVVNITAHDVSDNSTVTCTNGVETITGTVLSESCVVMLRSGTWSITVTDTSTVSKSTTLTVQAGTTYNVDISLTSYQKIQKWVREGTIQSHYSIGDQITVTHTDGNIIFDVVAFDVATPSDITKTHSMTLIPHYLLPKSMMFDNAEPNNSDSNRQYYGNDRYKDSNIRLWLNSDGVAGSWWTAQHSADAAPDYATTKAGFMNGFDADFLEVIGETKIKVVKNTITDGGGYEELVDKFYLPSTTEVGLANESGFAEGALFPYFSSNTQRTKSKSGSSAYNWWLRTPHSGGSFSARFVKNTGVLDYTSVKSALLVAPACNII